MNQRLLTPKDVQEEYKLGRSTSFLLRWVIPYVKVGRRILYRRDDVEALIERAAKNRLDIRTMILHAKEKANNPSPSGSKR